MTAKSNKTMSFLKIIAILLTALVILSPIQITAFADNNDDYTGEWWLYWWHNKEPWNDNYTYKDGLLGILTLDKSTFQFEILDPEINKQTSYSGKWKKYGEGIRLELPNNVFIKLEKDYDFLGDKKSPTEYSYSIHTLLYGKWTDQTYYHFERPEVYKAREALYVNGTRTDILYVNTPGVLTVSFPGNYNKYEVSSYDESVLHIDQVEFDQNTDVFSISVTPVQSGHTWIDLYIVPNAGMTNLSAFSVSIPVDVLNSNVISINSDANGNSILGNETIMSLMASCPSLTNITKSTPEYFQNLSDYEKFFPEQDGGIHTWRISIQNGVISFSDEKRMTVLTVKPTGTASEIKAVLKWEIQLIESVPTIKAAAEKMGVKLILEKRAYDGDYASFADQNGIIDLLNETKRSSVLKAMHDNVSLLEVIDSFSALGDLDKNGNGEIEFEELFGD